MSMFDVLQQHGTAALVRHLGAVAVFLLLHLIRIPLVVVARVLEIAMRRLDAFATRQASRPPTRPINHYFHHHTGFREEVSNVHA